MDRHADLDPIIIMQVIVRDMREHVGNVLVRDIQRGAVEVRSVPFGALQKCAQAVRYLGQVIG